MVTNQQSQDSVRPFAMNIRTHTELVNCIGRRKNNEDNCCINAYFIPAEMINENPSWSGEQEGNAHLFGVFDGVGGDAHGEVASTAAASYFAEQFSASETETRCDDAWLQLFREANQAVIAQGVNSCTTAVILHLLNGVATVYNTGDSRAYLYREAKLAQLSTDDTQQRSSDKASSAAGQPRATHEILRYLGEKEELALWKPHSSRSIPVEHDDLFLICSDGLTDALSNEDISAILSVQQPDELHAKALVDQAMLNLAKDNITLLLVRVLLA